MPDSRSFIVHPSKKAISAAHAAKSAEFAAELFGTTEPTVQDTAVVEVYHTETNSKYLTPRFSRPPGRIPDRILKPDEAIPIKYNPKRPRETAAMLEEHTEFHTPQDLCLPEKCPLCFDIYTKQEEQKKAVNPDIPTQFHSTLRTVRPRATRGVMQALKICEGPQQRQLYLGMYHIGPEFFYARWFAYRQLGRQGYVKTEPSGLTDEQKVRVQDQVNRFLEKRLVCLDLSSAKYPPRTEGQSRSATKRS